MKKNLLFSAAACIAIGASATVTDITPSGYIFNNVNEFSYYEKGCGGANIGTPAWTTVDGENSFNNGLAVVAGAPGYFGPNSGGAITFTKDDNKGGFTALIAGTSIVDLGGEVGKVLCINGKNSNLNDKVKELYNVDLNAPKLSGEIGWFNINFFSDPSNTPTNKVNEEVLNLRCRITLNVYHNAIGDGVTIADPYLVANMGGHTNVPATDIINTDDFIKFVDDDPTGDPEEGDDGNLVWNPNSWLVYEKNIAVAASDDKGTYSPVRLKFGVKPDVLQNGAFLIKSIEFFAVTADDAAASTDAIKSNITLKPNPATSGIAAVATDSALSYSINGNAVTFGENATIYTISGTQAATAVAGEAVELNAGFYVANAGGKAVKFAIK